MNLLLFGPPGAGKGTQSQYLVEKKNFAHISTGDLFRYNIKNQTPLGVEAKGFIDQGKLVPDSVTIGMVREHMKTLEGKQFILDGFPRTVVQAQALDELLGEISLNLDKVLFLEVPKDRLLERLTGRRVCKNCGEVYHVQTRPTSQEGICDKCGGNVVQRDDDKVEAISKRLEVYEESTKPVKDFYTERGNLVEIDGLGTSDEVFERVETHLKD